MTDSMLDFISFFFESLTGPDGLFVYSAFILMTGLLTGFILCFLLFFLSQFLDCVLPFFKRKLKVFKAKHHS